MSNFKEVKSCKCDDCLHDKICMYKKSLSDITSKLMGSIEDDKFSDEAPFIINIECQFKDKIIRPKSETINQKIDKNINQVIYQPNRVVSEVDKVAMDPIGVINTQYKQPIQTPPNNIKTIQNGVVTSEPQVTQKKKLTTEEKVAMMKEYASNQYIPQSDKIVTKDGNVPIQTPAE